MYSKTLLILITVFIVAGCNVESAPARWQQNLAGVYENYQATLTCDTPPDTGEFQQCNVSFSTLNGSAAELQFTQIEGGMPTHGHGLPTAPVLHKLDKPGTYRIDGLKYNMPGAWLLGFRVEGELGHDQIVFDFVI